MTIPSVRKIVTVPQPPDAAFRLFTEGFGDWWPLATHSVGLDAAIGVAVEPRVGGRIVEAIAGGGVAVWGTIEVWDPPHRLRCSWHPGTSATEATTVEVSFAAAGGGTRVELVHSGWDRRSEGWTVRGSYASGWDRVLARYVASAHPRVAPAG